MKKGYRYLLVACLPMLAVLLYFGYQDHLKKKQLSACSAMAASCFSHASGLRMAYLNEIGVIRQADIKENNDLKDTTLLLDIKRGLELVHRVEIQYDSASRKHVGNWQDSVAVFQQHHPFKYLDTLYLELNISLHAYLDFLDTIRPCYQRYYEKYLTLIDLLVVNNAKISIVEGKVVIMDKQLGIRFNELQVQFSKAVNDYNLTVEHMKSQFIARLRQTRTFFPTEEIDVFLALFEN